MICRINNFLENHVDKSKDLNPRMRYIFLDIPKKKAIATDLYTMAFTDIELQDHEDNVYSDLIPVNPSVWKKCRTSKDGGHIPKGSVIFNIIENETCFWFYNKSGELIDKIEKKDVVGFVPWDKVEINQGMANLYVDMKLFRRFAEAECVTLNVKRRKYKSLPRNHYGLKDPISSNYHMTYVIKNGVTIGLICGRRAP